MADLNLKLVIGGSNDGAIAALNQVVARAQASGVALRELDGAGNFGKTRAGVESISAQLARVQTLAASAVSGNFLIGMARDAVKASDEMKGVEATLKLSSRAWQEYSQSLAGVKQIAFEAGTALAANVGLVSKIAEPIRLMGGMQADVLATTQAVNNSLRIGRAATQESAAAMLQFAQAMGSGVLRGDELNSIMESAPRLAQAIAAGLGVTVGQLRDLGSQGALTSQQVFKALQSQQAVLAEEAARLPMSVGMAWTNAMEGIKQYVAELDKSTGSTDALASALNTVAKNIPAIAAGMADIALLAGVAFGARMIASISGYVAAQRVAITTNQLAAASSVKQAETELAVQQALAAKAAAELRAVVVTQSYTLATNEAAAAAARRAAAERMAAANQGVVAASGALAIAKTAETAASVGLLGRAMAGASVAGRGLLALFGGPLGLAVTAITAAALAWDYFASKSKKATEETQIPVKDLIKQFKEFSGKAGPNELEDQLVTLRGRAAELRDQLLDPAFRKSDLGKAAANDLRELDAAIDQASTKIKKFNSERVQEKGQLGLDKLKVDAGGLIDQDMLKSLKAFETLYKDFVEKAVNDNGQLKVSALEARAALEKLFSQAKTPADFSGVINRLGDALKANPKDSTLQATLENAIEARSQAEQKALSSLVSGLEARAKRTQSLFTQSASMALAQYNQAYALAKVAAELNNDAGTVSRIDTNGRNAEVTTAVQSANLQINALEEVATRKRQLAQDGAAATKAAADAEIQAVRQQVDQRLATYQKEVDEGKKTAGQLKDYRVLQEKEFLEKTNTARAARGQAEADAARQIRQVDADSAQQRAAIAESLYKTLQGKAQDALSQYKTYAAQVIALDKSISNNRLDTNSAIASLQRTGMAPKEQLQSLRNELAAIQAATAEAFANGQKDYALELLNRQKSVAQQIGQQSGDGINKQDQIKEGSAALEQIGAQADAILQEQRAAAQAAAQQQLKSYTDMTTAMNSLAQQIVALNENAAIKLKPEIDKASLDGAIAAVKTAFAGVTIPVNVQAVGLPAASASSPEIVSRAYGGSIPGHSPHDRADNILAWLTAGEHVMQLPAVRYYGRAFLDDINHMRLPKYAFGGAVGGSAVSRLSIPGLSAPAANQLGGSETPLLLDFGKLGRYQASAPRDTARDLVKAFKLAAAQMGNK